MATRSSCTWTGRALGALLLSSCATRPPLTQQQGQDAAVAQQAALRAEVEARNQRAKLVIERLAAHRFPEIHERLTPAIRAQLSVAELEGWWMLLEARFGAFVDAIPSTGTELGDLELEERVLPTEVVCTFERGQARVVLVVDADATIQQLKITCKAADSCVPAALLQRPHR